VAPPTYTRAERTRQSGRERTRVAHFHGTAFHRRNDSKTENEGPLFQNFKESEKAGGEKIGFDISPAASAIP
jgi:hypothetical protein